MFRHPIEDIPTLSTFRNSLSLKQQGPVLMTSLGCLLGARLAQEGEILTISYLIANKKSCGGNWDLDYMVPHFWVNLAQKSSKAYPVNCCQVLRNF